VNFDIMRMARKLDELRLLRADSARLGDRNRVRELDKQIRATRAELSTARRQLVAMATLPPTVKSAGNVQKMA